MTQFDIEYINNNCYNKQEHYCTQNRLPLFAYRTCPSCQVNLGQALVKTRTKEEAIEYAASTLITGCPNCGTTWCD